MKTKLFSKQEMVLAFLAGFALAMFIHTALFPQKINTRNAFVEADSLTSVADE